MQKLVKYHTERVQRSFDPAKFIEYDFRGNGVKVVAQDRHEKVMIIFVHFVAIVNFAVFKASYLEHSATHVDAIRAQVLVDDFHVLELF